MSGQVRRRNALLLVGHGSHISPDSSAPVFAHAARIRRLGIFDEVLEAFWKEEPCLPDALDLIQSENVWIVPIFLAEGYFTRQVLPRELGLDGPLTNRDGRTIHYCAPVGTHPSMADMILERASSVAGLDHEQRRDAALVVIGHGTERSPTSGDTVYELVERLRAIGEFGTVDCGFLDEAPEITDVLERIPNDDVVLVPFFVAEGWHTRTTIPKDLGLAGELTVQGTRRIWYTRPVGTLEGIADVVLAIAADAGAPTEPPSASTALTPLEGPLAAARKAFLEWVNDGARSFLQLRIDHTDSGFELRNSQDAARQRDELDRLPSPAAALDLVRFNANGGYRPLRASADLPGGWVLADLTPAELWEAIGFIYPGAALLWYRGRIGDLVPTPFDRWAARQTGIYSGLRDLSEADVDRAIDACCAARGCHRTRLWSYSDTVPLDQAGAEAPVPCLEPCTLFATVARETARSTPNPHRTSATSA